MSAPRTLPWDWYPGTIPDNVVVDDTAYIETTYSFSLYRSEAPVGLRMGRYASAYNDTIFDVGPRGRVSFGECALAVGVRIICDAEVEIGDYALMSWNVVLMDSYRVPFDPTERQRIVMQAPLRSPRQLAAEVPARPIRIGRAAWIGFDVCILPGITIGDGSIIGARSVVMDDVPPYTIAAGNPARIIRRLDAKEIYHGL
jgi:acetyltransferase-like isoleucine patch superfamily enzyme